MKMKFEEWQIKKFNELKNKIGSKIENSSELEKEQWKILYEILYYFSDEIEVIQDKIDSMK